MCKCGEKARLDDVVGNKKGKRELYYVCDRCKWSYNLDEKSGVIEEISPD